MSGPIKSGLKMRSPIIGDQIIMAAYCTKDSMEHRCAGLLFLVEDFILVVKILPLPANLTSTYSPVMLNEWSKLGRLLLALLCSVLGILMNGFFVTSFFVEPHLHQIGFIFMGCVGVSDLIISITILPMTAVVLLSGDRDTDPVYYVLQFVTEGATYSYSLFFTMSAIESYYRLCKATSDYEILVSMRLGPISVILFAIAFMMAGAGVYLDLDYDSCHRSHPGNFIFRVTTLVIFHIIPFIVVFFCLSNNACRIRTKARKHNHYRQSQQYETETVTNNLNITSYFLFVADWIVVYFYPETTDSKYYHSILTGMFRSVICFLYGSMERHHRRAFAHLFNYCCCKSTLSGSIASRHRRPLECKPTGDVRVHIMHQAVNVNSPQRDAPSLRDTQEIPY